MYENGDVEDGMWWAGQSQGLIHEIASVEDVVRTIIGDAEQLMTSLPHMIDRVK